MGSWNRRAAIPTLFIVAFAAVLGAPDRAMSKGDSEQGEQLAKKWCSACHAIGSGPSGSDIAPTFAEIARRRSPDYVSGFLANPHDRGRMPAFDLSREQIEDLVRYLYRAP